MGTFAVQMPDGSVRQVQGTTLAAAINNAGGGASAPSSPTPNRTVSVSAALPTYAPAAAAAAPNPYGGAQGNWTTVNGQRTVPQMAQELAAAGYNGPTDPGSILSAYGRTTGGPISAGNGLTTTGGGPAIDPAVAPTAQQKFVDPTVQGQLLTAAQQAAYQAYLNSKLNLDTDDLAFRKATQAFSNKISEAGITGTYNGSPTLAAQQQQFSEGITAAGVTGMYNGAPTLAAQKQQQDTSLGYLNLISKLSGPQDYGSYLRTLGSTPGGLRDLVAGAAGQYVPSRGSTTGVQPVAASLGGLVNAAATGTSGGTTYADYQSAAGGLPAPNQISPAAWNAYTSSQKQALLGMYGQQGYLPTDVQDLYAASLPKYAYAGGTTGTVRM